MKKAILVSIPVLLVEQLDNEIQKSGMGSRSSVISKLLKQHLQAKSKYREESIEVVDIDDAIVDVDLSKPTRFQLVTDFREKSYWNRLAKVNNQNMQEYLHEALIEKMVRDGVDRDKLGN